MSLNCIIVSSIKELALQSILCTDHEMVLARNVMMRMRKFVTTHLEKNTQSALACYVLHEMLDVSSLCSS
jgi:archaellum biogenesis ATPase FlaH